MNKKGRESTGERLEFNSFSDVTIEHLHRYAIALEFVKGKRVLDIASGEGYGTFLLSKIATSVIGVDIDLESIELANDKYKSTNIEFVHGSTSSIPLLDNAVDVVISFETIEHHDKHDEMMIEIKRVLNPNGILIISSPDKKYYSDNIGQNNIYHIKELYFEEFKFLINKYFEFSSFYFQKAYNFNSYISDSKSYGEVVVFSGDNTQIVKNLIEPLYNIVIASDFENIKLQPSIFNGTKIRSLETQQFLANKISNIHNSITFKLGKFICFPFFYLKSKLKRFIKK